MAGTETLTAPVGANRAALAAVVRCGLNGNKRALATVRARFGNGSDLWLAWSAAEPEAPVYLGRDGQGTVRREWTVLPLALAPTWG